MPHAYQAEPYFKKRLRKKDAQRQQAVIDTIRKLAEDPTRPGLRVKRVQSAAGVVYEATIDMANRITFHWEGDMIVLRNNCKHDDVLRSP